VTSFTVTWTNAAGRVATRSFATLRGAWTFAARSGDEKVVSVNRHVGERNRMTEGTVLKMQPIEGMPKRALGIAKVGKRPLVIARWVSRPEPAAPAERPTAPA
jgi:hypothetical protein